MERRREPRVNFDQELTVTVLGKANSEPFPALAVDISGSGMRLLSPVPIPYGAPVKIQVGDFLLLGEVVRVQASDGGHTIALKLLHSLDLTIELYRLNEALREDTRPVIITQ